ncbi:mannose-6-phosphate isomerase, class I [Vibrio parahaemolyticus]|uniref:mannose-6-phosphate isomerase, class I n=2 Tax=Vibrio parahaemolyticus TaxID=670 RepID=UPI00235F829D|nr:mannose-6-phosphate isomerase, class I [Vibrio parahaemolyticus]EIZ1045647.1 mannose-6-phosphate isomerase, class I [Vibrio parahaemolyticus]
MAKFLFKLDNVIHNYAWGSKTSFYNLFGISNINKEPQAEMWMGAHPNGCSKAWVDNKTVLLSDLINTNKVGYLSKYTVEHFGDLPYLFKVLAADTALSVQVHPSKEEAVRGFLKENELGIDLEDPNRNFKDTNHKPELVYALTPYKAMNGFRDLKEIVALFLELSNGMRESKLLELILFFKNNRNTEGLKYFFIEILSLSGEDKNKALDVLLTFSTQRKQENEDDLFSLILELAESYPNDVGIFAPFFLNVITLKPGEAMFLEARTPHAYIKGTGLEVMASSDNVLRAGLTSKNVNVKELSKCTLFEPKSQEELIFKPRKFEKKNIYNVPTPDFCFECIESAENDIFEVKSAEIIFAIDAEIHIMHPSGELLRLKKGESAFIPAYSKNYKMTSIGRIARVYN